MAATEHLPAHQPKHEHELPQGTKNWDKPPQQVKGPEGPEPHPTPEEVGHEVITKRKPQQVKGPEGPDPLTNWPPPGQLVSDAPRPQQESGDEGPDATDGTELIEAAGSTTVEGTASVTSPAPAKKSTAKTTGTKGSK